LGYLKHFWDTSNGTMAVDDWLAICREIYASWPGRCLAEVVSSATPLDSSTDRAIVRA